MPVRPCQASFRLIIKAHKAARTRAEMVRAIFRNVDQEAPPRIIRIPDGSCVAAPTARRRTVKQRSAWDVAPERGDALEIQDR